jgi:hypothetical protein
MNTDDIMNESEKLTEELVKYLAKRKTNRAVAITSLVDCCVFIATESKDEKVIFTILDMIHKRVDSIANELFAERSIWKVKA